MKHYWKMIENNILNNVDCIYNGNSSAAAGYLHASKIVCRIAAKYDDPSDSWKALNEIAKRLETGVLYDNEDDE